MATSYWVSIRIDELSIIHYEVSGTKYQLLAIYEVFITNYMLVASIVNGQQLVSNQYWSADSY